MKPPSGASRHLPLIGAARLGEDLLFRENEMDDSDGPRPRRAGQYVSTFTPEKGREIVRRIAGGESLQAVCEDPRMPWTSTVWDWARRHPEFGAALEEARKAARVAARAERLRARFGRAAQARRPGGARTAYTPELAAEICERLAEGESLLSISRDPAMPTASAIYDWIERHPEFEAMYVRARRLQAETLFDMAREVAMGATPKTVWADRLRYDAIRWQAARLAPRKYMEPVVAAEAAAVAAAAARAAEGPDTFMVVRFVEGPNGEVLVAPPRCAEEAERWEKAYGRPYDGPGLLPGQRGPGGWEAIEGD